VCCNGTCCAGCCDANEQCSACIAFVTSTTYAGNLGGLTGADAKCQARAGVGGLPGLYKAWLSDSTQFPSTRFRCRAASCSAEGYRRVDGVTIASNWDDLTTCDEVSNTGTACLDAAINVTELNQLGGGGSVWTNTTTRGTERQFPAHCQNWTNGTSGTGLTGTSRFDNFGWTESPILQPCTAPFSLYCFQQN